MAAAVSLCCRLRQINVARAQAEEAMARMQQRLSSSPAVVSTPLAAIASPARGHHSKSNLPEHWDCGGVGGVGSCTGTGGRASFRIVDVSPVLSARPTPVSAASFPRSHPDTAKICIGSTGADVPVRSFQWAETSPPSLPPPPPPRDVLASAQPTALGQLGAYPFLTAAGADDENLQGDLPTASLGLNSDDELPQPTHRFTGAQQYHRDCTIGFGESPRPLRTAVSERCGRTDAGDRSEWSHNLGIRNCSTDRVAVLPSAWVQAAAVSVGGETAAGLRGDLFEMRRLNTVRLQFTLSLGPRN